MSFPLSNFGEMITVTMTPVIQILSSYGNLDEQIVDKYTSGVGSSIVSENGEIILTAGNGLYDYATILSKRSNHYRAGQGSVSRFTCKFNEPVANSLQIAGIGTAFNGFFFGYNGTDFGIMRRYGGKPEIYKLTITSAFTGAGTVAITLNGTLFNKVVATGSGSIPFSAHQLEGEYEGWDIEHVNNSVFFISKTDGPKNGTFSVTFGTSGGVGTLTQVKAGATKTETWIYKNQWNSQLLMVPLDPTKYNVYQIGYQYLGAGRINFSIEDNKTGNFRLVHMIKFPNANSLPSLENPHLKMLYAVASLGSTTQMVMKFISFGSFIEGELKYFEPKFSISSTKTNISAETTILTIRNPFLYNGYINHSNIIPLFLSFSTDWTKTTTIRVYKDLTLTGNTSTNFTNLQYISQQSSTVLYDTTNNSFTANTGFLLFSLTVGKVDNKIVDIADMDLKLYRGEQLTITAQSAANTEIAVSLSFVEDH